MCWKQSETKSCVFIQLHICLHYEENVNAALHSLQVESSLWLVLSELIVCFMCVSVKACIS